MPVTKDENDVFFKLFFSILSYVNEKLDILGFHCSPDEIKKLSALQIGRVRDAFYKNKHVIDYFVLENPYNLSHEEIEILEGWQHCVKKTFYVMAHLKNYSVFLDIIEPPKAYGVYSFDFSFKELVGNKLPIMVDAILLPLGDKIVCDSILDLFSHRPSTDLYVILKNAYLDAKAKHGIITSLTTPLIEKTPSDKDRLKFYLRDQTNREMFKYQIGNIIKKDPQLEMFFHRETNKIFAREIKRNAKKNGEKGLWFALFQGKVITTQETKEKVQEQLDQTLPENLKSLVHIFQI